MLYIKLDILPSQADQLKIKSGCATLTYFYKSICSSHTLYQNLKLQSINLIECNYEIKHKELLQPATIQSLPELVLFGTTPLLTDHGLSPSSF